MVNIAWIQQSVSWVADFCLWSVTFWPLFSVASPNTHWSAAPGGPLFPQGAAFQANFDLQLEGEGEKVALLRLPMEMLLE